MQQIETPEGLLIETAKILERQRLKYFITGGIAVSVWGKPRFTADIDIVVAIPSKNDTRKLVEELKKIDNSIYAEVKMAEEAVSRGGEFNIIHPNTGIKVDFWILGKSIFDKNRLRRAKRKKIKGQTIFFSSPEDLVLSKLFWYKESGSSRHLEDAQSVLKFSKVNWHYLKRWTNIQGTIEFLDKIKNHK